MLGSALGDAFRKGFAVNLIPDNDPRLAPLPRLLSTIATASGVRVSHQNATKAAIVYGAVTLTADTMSSLPVRFITDAAGTRVEVTPPDVSALTGRKVNPLQTRPQFIQTLLLSKLIAGEAFMYPRRTNGGDVAEIWLIDPDRVVEVERLDGEAGSIGLRFKVEDWPENNGWIENRPGQPVQLIHDPLHVLPGRIRGLSPIREAAELVGMSLSSQGHAARFLGNGVHMTGAIVVPAEVNSVEAQEVYDNFNLMHAGPNGAGRIGLLSGGADFKVFTIPPKELEFLDQMKYTDSKIAEVIYRVPPHLVGDLDKSTSWGTGIAEQSQNWVQYRLLNLAIETESVIEAALLPSAVSMKFSMNGLLRGVAKDRAEFYQILWGMGVLNQDDMRGFEDLPPLPDGLGKNYYVPLNYAPIGQQPDEVQSRARFMLEMLAGGR